MSKYRRNAVVIDFNVMPVRPDIETVTKFISKDLKLDQQRVKNLQLNNSRNHVIIELGSPEEASDLVDQHNLKHKVGCRGQTFRIPIFVEDNATQVRIHDLPPHMPNDLIVSHLEAYGEVKSIRREVWREYFPGIPNGVRVVRMVLKKPIPSFIKVETEISYTSYNQQVRTCRHCANPLHPGKNISSKNITTNRNSNNNNNNNNNNINITK
ncbi:MAP kinase phosphatase with leucine-rich repeats protein 3-like [Culex pipiens pallens]|uniref:MAP kinase phosphatase with leucine-rich repeats protein 3-like n=1 Tax=Culex pipiens pallens TaxID=42434 RepID=UPI0022AA89F3|nr:MAP kinase phosphatase with leucine-rich repeats protein 3-like [Culex pipiens pallens]